MNLPRDDTNPTIQFKQLRNSVAPHSDIRGTVKDKMITLSTLKRTDLVPETEPGSNNYLSIGTLKLGTMNRASKNESAAKLGFSTCNDLNNKRNCVRDAESTVTGPTGISMWIPSPPIDTKPMFRGRTGSFTRKFTSFYRDTTLTTTTFKSKKAEAAILRQIKLEQKKTALREESHYRLMREVQRLQRIKLKLAQKRTRREIATATQQSNELNESIFLTA